MQLVHWPVTRVVLSILHVLFCVLENWWISSCTSPAISANFPLHLGVENSGITSESIRCACATIKFLCALFVHRVDGMGWMRWMVKKKIIYFMVIVCFVVYIFIHIFGKKTDSVRQVWRLRMGILGALMWHFGEIRF